jgi:hypothetical protein
MASNHMDGDFFFFLFFCLLLECDSGPKLFSSELAPSREDCLTRLRSVGDGVCRFTTLFSQQSHGHVGKKVYQEDENWR